MFVMFFAIVFVAELIIVHNLVSLFIKYDTAICELNKQVLEVKPALLQGVSSLKSGIKVTSDGISNLTKFFSKKKYDIIKFLVKTLAAIFIVTILKRVPNKKFLTAIDIIFALGSIIKL